MEVERITGQGNSPPPFQKAANAVNEKIVAKYRGSDGTIDYTCIYNALGAFSGFGVQMAIREALVKPGKLSEDKAFVVVKTTDGKSYYLGDLLNEGLFGSPHSKISVWSLIGGAALSAGAKQLPDLREMASHSVKVLGTKAFGVPRVPVAFLPRETPYDVLQLGWKAMHELLAEYEVQPLFWGWTFALAAQYLLLSNSNSFDPTIAATIALEAAVSMSKVDPRDL
ncbi:hypothetical protein [Bradyrhizobium sp.]|uniref:hypothetical protein n=1 Tax=Bradyrhizobium sp. TaxID=376 RepID=UPI002624CD18|nr:hypothetical protein [Bradyrhizobium sp.]